MDARAQETTTTQRSSVRTENTCDTPVEAEAGLERVMSSGESDQGWIEGMQISAADTENG